MDEPDEEKCAKCPLGPPDWQYICHDCQNKFIMPVPKGPSEEKGRTCPKCGSANIVRTGIVKFEVCPPGG